MIIAVCTDDQMVDYITEDANRRAPNVFGNDYRVFDEQIPDLGANENLFLVAHGTAVGDENQPVIGSKGNHFYLTAKDLYVNLPIFPHDYRGKIYVYACESAEPGADGVSFVKALMKVMNLSYPHLRAFGQIGSPSGPIPSPDDGSWSEARLSETETV